MHAPAQPQKAAPSCYEYNGVECSGLGTCACADECVCVCGAGWIGDACEKDARDCPHWATQGFCERGSEYRVFMRRHCAGHCDIVDEWGFVEAWARWWYFQLQRLHIRVVEWSEAHAIRLGGYTIIKFGWTPSLIIAILTWMLQNYLEEERHRRESTNNVRPCNVGGRRRLKAPARAWNGHLVLLDIVLQVNSLAMSFFILTFMLCGRPVRDWHVGCEVVAMRWP